MIADLSAVDDWDASCIAALDRDIGYNVMCLVDHVDYAAVAVRSSIRGVNMAALNRGEQHCSIREEVTDCVSRAMPR